MKNKKLFDLLAAVYEKMTDEEKKVFDTVRRFRNAGELTERDAAVLADSVAYILGSFAAEVDADEKTESAKRSGAGSAKKAIEKILKGAPQEFLQKARMIDRRQVFCDSYILGALDQPVDLAPEYVQEVNDGRIDSLLARVLPDARENSGDVLTVPDAATLRAYIKSAKAEKKAKKDKRPVIFDFGDGLPAVNAENLVRVLDIFGDAVELVASNRGAHKPIYARSDRGEGVLMPVRKLL